VQVLARPARARGGARLRRRRDAPPHAPSLPHDRHNKKTMLVVIVATLSTPIPTAVEIAPGVSMPYINLGGVHSHPSNYSAWLDIGGRGLDTALMYGDDIQVEVGDAAKLSKLSRSDVFITSKVPCCPAGFSSWCTWYESNYKDLDAYTNGKIDLRLIGIDQVDLMLLHWPCATMADTVRTYKTLERFALDGKARAIGISNFNASAIDALYQSGLRVRPSVNQCGFSVGNHNNSSHGRDFETLAKCREKGITYSAYSPLGGLSGIDILKDPRVVQIGKTHNKSSAQVALRWVTQQGVVAVTASTSTDHLQSDLDIFDFTLTDAEMAALTKI
jgi:2,5-diketo-D-gluconate reductase A